MERFLLILLSSGFLSILSSFIPTIVLAQTKLLVDYNLTLEVESAVLARMEVKNYQRSTPPINGKCNTGHNCWQNVKWQEIPNSYSDFAGGYDYIGINTIVRSGNAINFDFYSDGGYVRYSGNCRTNVLASTKSSDSGVNPNYSAVGNELRRRALRFACSRR